jgi:hypothetical protein
MPLLKPSDPASPKILQILAIQWGVIFARKYPGRDAGEQREARLLYASAILGRDIESFKALTMGEAVKLQRAFDNWPK